MSDLGQRGGLTLRWPGGCVCAAETEGANGVASLHSARRLIGEAERTWTWQWS